MIDPIGRTVDYLRISITDRCNERCLYCLPESFSDWLPREDVLTFPELLAIAETAASLGVRHFRVTGGEPLLRRGVVDFIEQLVKIPGVETVNMTTNGTRLPELARPLFNAGLRAMNISLDALNPESYRAITRGDVRPVLDGIRLARELGFQVKLNTVLIRGKNELEILPLIHFAAEHDLTIRFIELMPVSLTEMLDETNFLPALEVYRLLEKHDDVSPLHDRLGFGPARYYRMKNLGVTIGLIGALTDVHFCDRCNKMRVTCDGRLRPCLGNHLETDLKPALRPDFDREGLRGLFLQTLNAKPAEHLFRENYQPGRIMTAIGG